MAVIARAIAADLLDREFNVDGLGPPMVGTRADAERSHRLRSAVIT
jgi:hypothetical protein